jgi:hypothetical protein
MQHQQAELSTPRPFFYRTINGAHQDAPVAPDWSTVSTMIELIGREGV